jgi:hypothetical protein
MMVLHKENTGGDNLAVGVTLPDGDQLWPMPVQGLLFPARPGSSVESPSQTGSLVVNADYTRTAEGSLNYGTPVFTVSSGPCAVSEGGRCVGRPQGYNGHDSCDIHVSGGGGVLGPCRVFDLQSGAGSDQSGTFGDYIQMPRDDINPNAMRCPGCTTHFDSDCPMGFSLRTGDYVRFRTDGNWQGTVGRYDDGCQAKGTCGLPWSENGLGGGWEICFPEFSGHGGH